MKKVAVLFVVTTFFSDISVLPPGGNWSTGAFTCQTDRYQQNSNGKHRNSSGNFYSAVCIARGC